jgi:hypothetical protein
MTSLRRFIAMACAASVCAAGAAPPPVAFFSTGDRLPGTITAIDGSMAQFTSPALLEPANIKLKELLELRSQTTTRKSDADHTAIVTLTNGNVIRGQLASLDGESVILDTWYAGRLPLRRNMVASLRVIDRSSAIYSGPGNKEGWILAGNGNSGKKDNPPWIFENGTMISKASGSAARNLDLPDSIAVAFDLAWNSNLRFDLLIFSDNPKSNDPENFYALSINRHYTQFLKKSNSTAGTIGSVSLRSFLQKEKVHIELFADRAKGNFILAIDGKRIVTWRDPNPAKQAKGNSIHFITTDPTQNLRISRIDIRAWDGRVAEDDTPKVESEKLKPIPPGSQRIRLRNGDIVTGKVLGVEKDHITIETPHATIHLPLVRMSQVVLHREDEKNTESCHPPKIMNGDVKAWFPEGGNVVFRLDGIEGDHFIGYSQVFGTARFRRDAFSRVEFNIYADELEPLRPRSN